MSGCCRLRVVTDESAISNPRNRIVNLSNGTGTVLYIVQREEAWPICDSQKTLGDIRGRETVRRALNRVRQRLLEQGIPRAQQLPHFKTSFRTECWVRA